MNVGGQFMLVLRFSVATDSNIAPSLIWTVRKVASIFIDFQRPTVRVWGEGGTEEVTCSYCAPHEQLFVEIRISLC